MRKWEKEGFYLLLKVSSLLEQSWSNHNEIKHNQMDLQTNKIIIKLHKFKFENKYTTAYILIIPIFLHLISCV